MNTGFTEPKVLPALDAHEQGYRALTIPIEEQWIFENILKDMQGIDHCVVLGCGGPEVWRKGMKYIYNEN